MMNMFDGRKIRNEILDDLKIRVASFQQKPVLAVIWIGEDFATARYIESKERAAEKIGVHFDLFKYPTEVTQEEVEKKILELNQNQSVDGIMIQIPIPEYLNLNDLIKQIDPAKDVDGLNFCRGGICNFRPPVTISIMEAIKRSGINYKESKIAIIGKGFLVGSPLARMLESENADIRIADEETPYLATITSDADIVISATGTANLIKPDMVKNGVVLIDAGTTEVGGELRGDIDINCYRKASFYTPVPGGIGPMTVAMLFANLVKSAETRQA
ncbi:MAG: bifunctional 5,10-methylenetetrahydrofolate dehydrogenase/5,10-methenyltetrahydrofolate cyclohydrolase [Patescibacteria group bacterium]